VTAGVGWLVLGAWAWKSARKAPTATWSWTRETQKTAAAVGGSGRPGPSMVPGGDIDIGSGNGASTGSVTIGCGSASDGGSGLVSIAGTTAEGGSGGDVAIDDGEGATVGNVAIGGGKAAHEGGEGGRKERTRKKEK
jgi:hypothetical protein